MKYKLKNILGYGIRQKIILYDSKILLENNMTTSLTIQFEPVV